MNSFAVLISGFGVLPTGFGKSLYYACLPLIFDKIEPDLKSIIIVVTPLTAIVKDQVNFCTEYNNNYKQNFIMIEDSELSK